MRATTVRVWVGTAALCLLFAAGCSIGPRSIEKNRLRYNEAVKTSSEEQLLLNIVRLRYTDTPSSLAVTTIADQSELVHSLKAIPLLAASGDAVPHPFSRVLPQAELSAASRPTISLTPQDDVEFTKRLFTPISLESVASLSKTTWPISTVFRLWLENINWVSNAETISGPTPKTRPVFEEYLHGMLALQSLQDRKVVSIIVEERDEKVGDPVAATKVKGKDLVDAAKENYEFHKDDQGKNMALTRKKQQPVIRVAPGAAADPEFLEFCRIFRLDPRAKSFDMVADKLDPYLTNAPPGGLAYLDLETRSLLQVLFFVAHGVEVPPEHVSSGIVPVTLEPDGRVFDYEQVLGGLFKVCSCKGHKPPPTAHVAVCYQGYWFYIDERDRDTKATFALLVELSRIELASKGAAPVLTLPVGAR